MKSEHVTIFLPSLAGGGAQRMMLNLALGFAERVLTVDLVLQRAEGPYLSQVSDKVRIVDLKARSMALALFPLMSYLHRERPLSLLSAMTHTNVIAILAKKLAKVDTHVVISERNTLSVSSRGARSLRGRYLPLLAKRIYPSADGIVAVSEGVADDLARTLGLPRKRIKVIYNPVVTPELLEKAKEPVDHPWFQPSEPPVILGVGRLSKQKDFPTLFRAFALVRKRRAARLMILGEGEER
jgi:glycosyltransferase involved in cell wall biosynthesis